MKYLVWSSVLLLLAGCSFLRNNSNLNDWVFKDFDSARSVADGCVGDRDREAKKLTGMYAENPYDEEYPQLVFSRCLSTDEGAGYYVFDIQYVDDVQVVFLVNDSGRVIDNYLVSSF